MTFGQAFCLSSIGVFIILIIMGIVFQLLVRWFFGSNQSPRI